MRRADYTKTLPRDQRRKGAHAKRLVPVSYYAAAQRPRGETNWWRSNWPYWVVPLLALAGLLWYLLPRERETVAVTTPKSVTEPMRDVQTKSAFLGSALDSWISIGSAPNEYVNKQIYSGTGEKLGTIKDVLVGPDGKMAAVIINVGKDALQAAPPL